MDDKSCLVFNLQNKNYERQTLQELLDSGWRVTTNKLKVEFDQNEQESVGQSDGPPETENEDLLKLYGTEKDDE